MAYASRSGRARTNSSAPMAHAICDRCGFRYNHSSLSWQFDWRGAALGNTRLLVCPLCLDNPQEQQRAIVLPADPIRVMQPRIENFDTDSTNYHTASRPTTLDPKTGIPVPGTTTFLTPAGDNRSQQPIGLPAGIDPNAVMPFSQQIVYRTQLSVTSLVSNGTDRITITCSSAHNLTVGSQILVEGALAPAANGAFSILSSPTATMLTYQTNIAVLASGLLTGSTLVLTATIGVPRGFSQIPQTGVGNRATAVYPALPAGVFDQSLWDGSVWS